MICFLYLFAGLILITHISGLFLSLLRMVLSGVLNCTKLSHFQLVNYIYFTIPKLPMCNTKILKFSMCCFYFYYLSTDVSILFVAVLFFCNSVL